MDAADITAVALYPATAANMYADVSFTNMRGALTGLYQTEK